MKKIMSLILAIVLTIGLVPQFAVTADAATYEYAWFPAPQMKITQIAYESYSHGSQNAIDLAPGGSVFAPFTGKITYLDERWGYVVLQSTNKVYYADGTLDYMTVAFMHDENISNLSVGQIISQGTKFYQAGGMGNGTPDKYANHVHLSIHKGKSRAITSNGKYGAGNVYAYNAFYVNRDKTTKIVKQGKMASGNYMNKGAPSNWSGKWKDLPFANIITQPKSVTVFEGETAKVSVKASGEGLTYKWYYKNKGASKFSLTSSFTGSTYSVTMDSRRDGQQVYCKVTDKHGNSETSKTVTLSMAKITTQPKSVTVAEGEKAKTSITTTGSGLTYQWYYKDPGKSSFSKSSLTGTSYAVTMSSKNDGRKIYCKVTDTAGNAVTTNTVTLSIKKTAKITTQPKAATATSGSTAKVSIKATGDGLTYQWYYKNPGKSSFSRASATGATYSATMSSKNDGQQVYCKVTDKYGNTVKSNTVTLSIKRTAKITTQPKSVTVITGNKAKTSIKATGDGLTYQWYYKDPGKSSYTKSTLTGATYTLTMSSKNDGRKIYCKVTDKYGNTVKSNTVTLSISKVAKTTYSSYCTIKATAKTSAMSLPCSSGTDKNSTMIESVAANKTYTATALILNTQGNYWYQVKTSSGKTAYIPSSKVSFVKDLTKDKEDITITGVKAPTSLTKGKAYSIEGTIKSTYSNLYKVGAFVYPGKTTSVKSATGGTATTSKNSYSLKGSAVDNRVAFNELPAGKYTFAVYGYYKNYYAKTEKTRAETTGRVCLYKTTFTVK